MNLGTVSPIPLALRVRQWIVRRRVTLSLALFGGLIGHDLSRSDLPKFSIWDGGDWQACLGHFLVVAGIGLRSWSAGILQKGRRLTTSGPYSLCRNPLYLGSFLMMLGFSIIIGCYYNVAAVLGPIAFIYALTIASEEARLESRYTDGWRNYAAAAPRLWPRLRNYSAGEWSSAQWRTSREYFAFGLGTSALVLLEALSLR